MIYYCQYLLLCDCHVPELVRFGHDSGVMYQMGKRTPPAWRDGRREASRERPDYLINSPTTKPITAPPEDPMSHALMVCLRDSRRYSSKVLCNS